MPSAADYQQGPVGLKVTLGWLILGVGGCVVCGVVGLRGWWCLSEHPVRHRLPPQRKCMPHSLVIKNAQHAITMAFRNGSRVHLAPEGFGRIDSDCIPRQWKTRRHRTARCSFASAL